MAPRDEGEGPILYPFACAPQAWAAASLFLLFQACLALRISAVDAGISFLRPRFPAFLQEARIANLQVAGGNVDLALIRRGDDISVSVVRKQGDVEMVAFM